MNRPDDTTRPIVTIGLPVYNGERYIAEAIESALAQTFTQFELVISDNASTDKTLEICKKYCERDSRIVYARQEANKGAYYNFFHVLRNAKGKYFTWLAHDDLMHREFLAESVAYLEKAKGVVLVSGDFKGLIEEGVESSSSIVELNSIREHVPWGERYESFFRYPPPLNTCFCMYGLFITEVGKAATTGMRLPNSAVRSELPFLSRVASAGQIVSVPREWRVYRWHQKQLHRAEGYQRSQRGLISLILNKVANALFVRTDLLFVLFRSKFPLSWKLKTSVRKLVTLT